MADPKLVEEFQKTAMSMVTQNRLLRKLYKRDGVLQIQQNLNNTEGKMDSALDKLVLDLPGAKIVFDPSSNGSWNVDGKASASSAASKKEMERIQKRADKLAAEKNVLELKCQLLLDTLTLTTLDLSNAEQDLTEAEQEIQRLRSILSSSSAGTPPVSTNANSHHQQKAAKSKSNAPSAAGAGNNYNASTGNDIDEDFDDFDDDDDDGDDDIHEEDGIPGAGHGSSYVSEDYEFEHSGYRPSTRDDAPSRKMEKARQDSSKSSRRNSSSTGTNGGTADRYGQRGVPASFSIDVGGDSEEDWPSV